ncbi:MAG: DUF6057 family protein [Prevotella sp.]|nr:DUF6057 family protein [Prevotella sp.]
MKRNILTRLAQPAIILLWGLLCWAFFQFGYAYHFFYQEQNQLFLLTQDYLLSYFSHPAWLACLAGDFLTQFYYFLYAGAIILTVTLLMLGDTLRRALQRAGMGQRMAFLLAVILMTVEATFCFRASFRLSSILAGIGGAGLYLIYSQAEHLYRRISPLLTAAFRLIALFLCTLSGFWLFGYGAAVFSVMVLIQAYYSHRRIHLTATLAAAALSLALISLGKPYYQLNYRDLYAYPGLGKIGLPDFAVERIMAADNEYYFGHDNKVINLVLQTPQEERTPQLTFFYNLASARQHQLADNLLKIQPTDLGVFTRIGPDTPLLTINSIHELYYLLGDMTFTERAAMMANVFSPNNRNVRMMKRLAESNLISGDRQAAMKYLRILCKTMCYHSWATHHLPGKETPAVRRELDYKRQFINRQNSIRTTDNARTIITELLNSNPGNEAALHYLLCSDLLLKDMDNFWKDYDRFCLSQGNPRQEKLYQEAIMVYLAGKKASENQWKRYITRPDLLERFNQYNQQRGSQAFKDTYWYYFDTHK